MGVELAQAYRRLGAGVTLFEQAERIVPQADPEASALLADQLTDEGVQIVVRADIQHVRGDVERVELDTSTGPRVGDLLLVAGGRRPQIDGLDLERAGVRATPRGITVDARLRTNQAHIFACGDVVGSWQFTHYAGWQGFVAARNALLPVTTAGQRTPPWAIFTDPEIAQVGLTEDQAGMRWRDTRVERWPVERNDRAQTAGETRGLLKLIARRNGVLVGATLVGSAAGEMANELALAIDQRLRLRDLAQTLHIYPTYGITLQQASAAATIRDLTVGWQGRILRRLAKR